jgi:hypothetical protein
MATTSGSIAVDIETRDRLNKYVQEYNAKNPQAKDLYARDFIRLALDYFQRTGIDFNSDVVALPTTQEQAPSQELTEVKEMFLALSKMYADTNLKVTAIGQGIQQGFETLGETQQQTRLLLESKSQRTEKDDKEMENLHLKYMGEALKYWRKKNKISVYELSQKTRINYHAVKNIEAGNKSVQLKTFLRYAWYIKETDQDFNLMQVYTRWHNFGIGENGEDASLIRDMAEVLDAPEIKDILSV